MRMLRFLLFISLSILEGCAHIGTGSPRESGEKTGFLVMAPDRGYLGNQEIEAVFTEFAKQYPARLIFISLSGEYDTAIREELSRARRGLEKEGFRRSILLPLVFSEKDPHLKKMLRLLRLEDNKENWTVAPTLSEDYRIAQILEDRSKAQSRAPEEERLIVIGYGATNIEEEEAIRSGLLPLIEEARVRLPFKEVETLILYHPAAEEADWKKADERARKRLQEVSSKKDLRNIVVPFHFGFKHTGSMQLRNGIGPMLSGLGFDYNGEEIFPHPNLLRSLEHSANRVLAPDPDRTGVVVLAHGAGHYYNKKILETVAPLREKIPTEIAFGMADTGLLEEAISKLESRGIRRIHVVRLYDTAASLKEATEYVLGLRKSPAGHGHGGLSARVRSSALLSTSGGLEDHPLISEVLLHRVQEVSREPSKETVILLAHGARSDETNLLWLKKMEAQAQFIKERSKKPFKAIHVATLREDWPEKREKAVEEIRKIIEEASKNGGRAIVISNRITGAGPYQKYLKGLDYIFNGTGIAPHPNLTRWIDLQVESWMKEVIKEQGTEGR